MNSDTSWYYQELTWNIPDKNPSDFEIGGEVLDTPEPYEYDISLG